MVSGEDRQQKIQHFIYLERKKGCDKHCLFELKLIVTVSFGWTVKARVYQGREYNRKQKPTSNHFCNNNHGNN